MMIELGQAGCIFSSKVLIELRLCQISQLLLATTVTDLSGKTQLNVNFTLENVTSRTQFHHHL